MGKTEKHDIEPISCELSKEIKVCMEWIEWSEKAFHEYATKILMIKKTKNKQNEGIKRK